MPQTPSAPPAGLTLAALRPALDVDVASIDPDALRARAGAWRQFLDLVIYADAPAAVAHRDYAELLDTVNGPAAEADSRTEPAPADRTPRRKRRARWWGVAAAAAATPVPVALLGSGEAAAGLGAGLLIGAATHLRFRTSQSAQVAQAGGPLVADQGPPGAYPALSSASLRKLDWAERTVLDFVTASVLPVVRDAGVDPATKRSLVGALDAFCADLHRHHDLCRAESLWVFLDTSGEVNEVPDTVAGRTALRRLLDHQGTLMAVVAEFEATSALLLVAAADLERATGASEGVALGTLRDLAQLGRAQSAVAGEIGDPTA